jgi:hypothetical protein
VLERRFRSGRAKRKPHRNGAGDVGVDITNTNIRISGAG